MSTEALAEVLQEYILITHATVWYASFSAGETKELHRVVQTAKCIAGMEHPHLESRRLTVSAKTVHSRDILCLNRFHLANSSFFPSRVVASTTPIATTLPM